MKKLMTAVALLITGILHAQKPWEKIAINEHVKISFPAQPLSNKDEGRQSYMLKLEDSTANLIVATTDMQVLMGLDESTLAAAMDKEESWEQAKTGFLKSLGADASLVSDELLTFKNTKAMRMTIHKKTDKGDTNVLTVLIFIKGTCSYNVIFNSRAGKGDEKTKEQFFNGIEIS